MTASAKQVTESPEDMAARLTAEADPAQVAETNGQYLSRDDVRAVHESASDIEILEVEPPGWGGKVLLRTQTGRARDGFELWCGNRQEGHEGADTFRARFATTVVCDAEGKPLFEPDDAEWLADMGAPALLHIYEHGKRLAGLDDDDEEELMGNSEAVPGETSSVD